MEQVQKRRWNSMVPWVIFAAGIALMFGFSYFKPTKSVPVPERALLYSIGFPAELRLRQFGDNVRLASNIEPKAFTISRNCQIVLSSGRDGRRAFVQVMDLKDKSSTVHYADEFFLASDVYSFTKLSVGPDHRSFAAVGLRPGSIRTLFISDGSSVTTAAYTWLEDDATGIRWLDATTLILETDPEEKGAAFQYILADIKGDIQLSSLLYYKDLRYSDQGIHDGLPKGTHKALSCFPAYREQTLSSTDDN